MSTPSQCTEQDARAAALALPETAERPCYGTPGFYVRGRLFARIWDGQDGVLVLRCADLDAKDLLLAADPPMCFTTPHYDGHPHVLLRLAAVDRAELAELLEDAWRSRAPKRTLAGWNRGSTPDNLSHLRGGEGCPESVHPGRRAV